MSVGGHDKVPEYNRDDDLEWWAEHRMGIRDVRALHNSLNYYLSIWPGPPERPEDEKKFIENIDGRLFAMISDYTYTHHEVAEENDDSTPSGDDT